MVLQLPFPPTPSKEKVCLQACAGRVTLTLFWDHKGPPVESAVPQIVTTSGIT